MSIHSTSIPRFSSIDFLRGLAIFLMVIYHFIFDLNFFGIYSIPLDYLPIVLFRTFIGFLFISISGYCASFPWALKNFYGRGISLCVIALLISIVTFIYPHDSYIKFGVIHFLAICTLLSPFLLRFRSLLPLFALGCIFVGTYLWFNTYSIENLFWLGIVSPAYSALDHYPLLPWLGVFSLGLYLGSLNSRLAAKYASSLRFGPLEWLGRNSLLIYLVHQPVLIGLLLLFFNLF
ncbi:DUF1624 domain-containing protein [Candidatus Micrarchaeota archaeon]|nr:DUF1624 domain-containing protein [Candidatus Micrarchaeota archaeon]